MTKKNRKLIASIPKEKNQSFREGKIFGAKLAWGIVKRWLKDPKGPEKMKLRDLKRIEQK